MKANNMSLRKSSGRSGHRLKQLLSGDRFFRCSCVTGAGSPKSVLFYFLAETAGTPTARAWTTLLWHSPMRNNLIPNA